MNRNDPSIDLTIDHATPMKDHNAANLALQKRIGELNAIIIQRDDQMRELQQQLAAARAQIADMRRSRSYRNEPHA